MILDTDIGNSWDDQCALAYLLKCTETFNLQAITIAPFKRSDSETIIANQEKSYNEIIKIGRFLGQDLTNLIYKFSEGQAVDKIQEIVEKNEKTYILSIGTLTNIYKAIQKNPDIIKKIEIIWLGGNSIEYGSNKEFNFMQDAEAAKYLINSNVQMTIIPARNVTTELLININELKSRLNMNKKFSKYVCDIFENDSFYGRKHERVLWDISVIAYMRNKDWFEIEENLKLGVSTEYDYIINSEKQTGNISIVKHMDRTQIYNDLFNELNK